MGGQASKWADRRVARQVDGQLGRHADDGDLTPMC